MCKSKKLLAVLLSAVAMTAVGVMGGCGNNESGEKVEMQQRLYVNKKANTDFKILQITDTQIIDPTQEAFEGRLTPEAKKLWANREANCFKYVRQLIEEQKPDMIVLTGDNVYGSFDADGSNFTALVDLIDGYDIPWAPVFGNHDGETYSLEDPRGPSHPWGKGYDWQMDYLMHHTKNCLFDPGPEGIDDYSRHGNYVVDIKEGDKTVYALFMMDSHDNVTEMYGLRKAQVDWYASQVEQISYERNGKKSLADGVVPSMLFQHIPTYQHYLASLEYTQDGMGIISEGTEVLENGDWGQLRDIPAKSSTYKSYSEYLWQKVQQYGSTKAICVGHSHTNAMRIKYQGADDAHAVQLVFGVKTGTFDYWFQLGGTAITIKEGKDEPEILPVYLEGSKNIMP